MTRCALVFTYKMHLYVQNPVIRSDSLRAAAENDAAVEIFLHDSINYTTQYMQM